MHVVWEFVQQFEVGDKVFKDISAHNALWTLRGCLSVLRIDDAEAYRCHDLRRGHADDLREDGASMAEIKTMLDHFSDAAKLKYLDLVEMEASSVERAHVDVSSSEDWEY